MSSKAFTDFGGYLGPALVSTAQIIHDAVLAAAATFKNTPMSMADFQLSITTCDSAYKKKASRATVDINAYNLARQALEDNCSQLASYVNTVAQGDETIVIDSGAPYYQTGSTPDYSAPGAPENVVLRQGKNSGEIMSKCSPQRTPAVNEVQTCTGDPAVEANWTSQGMFNGTRATVGGFKPADTVWVRIRTAGLQGVMSNFSQPVKLVVN